jgi:hypothetical protein
VLIGGLLVSLTINSSVSNLLVKRTHDCRLVGVSVAKMVFFLLPKDMGSWCFHPVGAGTLRELVLPSSGC